MANKLTNDELKDMKIDNLSNYVEYITAGGTPSTSVQEYWENGNIPWMSSGEVNKKIITDTDKYITQFGYNNSSTKYIDTNCVLIALAGQGKTRGTVAINKIPICTNQSIAAIKTSEKLDYNYLYQYLTYKYNDIRDYSSGDGGRGGLNLTMLKNYKIQVCDIDVQKKIAKFLSLIDDLIQQSIELENMYSLKKKSYMQKIFSKNPNLKYKGFNDNWRKKQLSELVTYTQPTKFLVKEVTSSGIVPILTPNKSFIIGYTDNIDIAYKAKNNPVIIFDDFTTDHKYVDFDFTMKSSATKILTSKEIDIKFFEYLFQSIDYKPESHRRHWIELFANFDVSIPSSEEITKITRFLSLLDDSINDERKLQVQYKLMKKHYLNIIFK